MTLNPTSQSYQKAIESLSSRVRSCHEVISFIVVSISFVSRKSTYISQLSVLTLSEIQILKRWFLYCMKNIVKLTSKMNNIVFWLIYVWYLTPSLWSLFIWISFILSSKDSLCQCKLEIYQQNSNKISLIYAGIIS